MNYIFFVLGNLYLIYVMLKKSNYFGEIFIIFYKFLHNLIKKYKN